MSARPVSFATLKTYTTRRDTTESEVYTSNNRRVWPIRNSETNSDTVFPLHSNQLRPTAAAIRPARNLDGLANQPAFKMADIHIKMDSNACPDQSSQLVAKNLIEAGFYKVITWGGNTVMTAQFASGAKAKRVYDVLASFFDVTGGATEMTLEHCYAMWRSTDKDSGALVEVPPICMGPIS